MIILKNRSDESRNPSTIKITLTEHPVTNTKEWVKYPTDEAGNIDKIAAKRMKPEDKSDAYNIVIEPGQVFKFGEGSKYNEEQAEYIYAQYGSPEFANSEGVKNNNWLIEIDKYGNEVKDYLYNKYRARKGQEVYSGKQRIVIKQE